MNNTAINFQTIAVDFDGTLSVTANGQTAVSPIRRLSLTSRNGEEMETN